MALYSRRAARTKSRSAGLNNADCAVKFTNDGADPSRLNGYPHESPSPEPTMSWGRYWSLASRYEANARWLSAFASPAAGLCANASSTARFNEIVSAVTGNAAHGATKVTSSEYKHTRTRHRAGFIASPSV